ncbi:MAG: hypothetical protein JXB50_16960 [Spirochaetes bacterium]|nr:hypothetical protein [Spirochaetota bacterium]
MSDKELKLRCFEIALSQTTGGNPHRYDFKKITQEADQIYAFISSGDK